MKQTISLNGEWKFIPTHDQKPTNNHNVVESNVPFYAVRELNRTGWDTVTVPGVWQTYTEKYSVYEGVCWFYREFDVESLPRDAFAQLVCKGIDYQADVYVNGRSVGTHESAYTEFSLDVTAFLKVGRNAIAIRVDNRPMVVKWPNDWGYGVFGGIHRDIFIDLFSGEYVCDLEITPDYDAASGEGVLCIKARGTASAVEIELENRGKAVIRSKKGRLCRTVRYADISPWSPDAPTLYSVSVRVNGELSETYRVGFRSVRCKSREFLLNGKPYELKGACYLCDSPKSGLAMTEDELRADLTAMKNANVNAVRTHYPMSDCFYSLCDELGFLVWIEPNIYCAKPSPDQRNTVFKQRAFVSVAVSMTEEMIRGARRFASVAIFGIGNECNIEHPEAVPFFEKIAKTVRKGDPTRPVGYASLYGCCKAVAHIVDVMGINSYFGWYGVIDLCNVNDERNGVKRTAEVSELLSLIRRVERETGEDTVILLTEFGGDSVPGYLSPECALWSENYHAQVVEKYLETARAYPGVAGYFVFAFTDYHDPSKVVNGRWNGFNLKGMLSFEREIKLPYYALQKGYSDN